jgi:hypothetical protein
VNGRRLRPFVLGAAALVVVLLVASQLLLPGIAERRVRGMLEDVGNVQSVEVSAFPALKLLAKHADRVEVHMTSYASSPRRLTSLLAQAKNVDEVDGTADRVAVSLVRLRDGRLRKRGDALTGSALLEVPSLLRALPPGFDVRLVDDGPERGVVVEGQVAGVRGRARVQAADGAIVVAPDFLLGALATVTVFRDGRVAVTDLRSAPAAGGLRVTVRGRLG